jgi:hypothetical protein
MDLMQQECNYKKKCENDILLKVKVKCKIVPVL